MWKWRRYPPTSTSVSLPWQPACRARRPNRASVATRYLFMIVKVARECSHGRAHGAPGGRRLEVAVDGAMMVARYRFACPVLAGWPPATAGYSLAPRSLGRAARQAP